MVFFLGGVGTPKMGDSDSLRVYAMEDSMDDSVFAAGIHRLKYNWDFFLVFCVQLRLKFS